MKKWEYKVVVLGNKQATVEPLLNSFGAEGWELVAVKVVDFGPNTAFLKREKT